mgnify:CR=1 FL=1
MKQLIQLVHSKIKTGYYYQELKELTMAATVITAAWVLFNYGKALFQWIISPEGMIWCAYGMVCVIIALVIKIYFRILVIKYHEKDTRIELFRELESK